MGDAEVPQAGQAVHPVDGDAVEAMFGDAYLRDALPLVEKWCGYKPV
jgi:hypothetical protein